MFFSVAEGDKPLVVSAASTDIEPASLPEIPEHAQYLLVGAGTASFAAFRAIKSKDPRAKVELMQAWTK